MYISSRQNQHVLQVKELLSERQSRLRDKLCVVEGYTLCKENPLTKLFVRDGVTTDLLAPEVYTLAPSLFDSISDTQNPQGVLGLTPISYETVIPRQGQYIYCDRLQDPGNLGTIVRTAVCFGFSGIVIGPETTDPFSPKAVRSSMGAVFRLPVIFADCQPEFPIIVADLQGEDIRRFIPPQDYILAIGNEGQGVSRELQERSAYSVRIPIQFESLNAAVAAAICMYQFKK